MGGPSGSSPSGQVLETFLQSYQQLRQRSDSTRTPEDDPAQGVTIISSEQQLIGAIASFQNAKALYVAVHGYHLTACSKSMSYPADVFIDAITIFCDDSPLVIRKGPGALGRTGLYSITVHQMWQGDEGGYLIDKYFRSTAQGSLRCVFENADVEKTFWDAGIQGCALRDFFGWDMKGVVDLQIADWLGSNKQSYSSAPTRSLVDCMAAHQTYITLVPGEAAQFVETKLIVESLADVGGLRTAAPDRQILRYYANQVRFLPILSRRCLDQNPATRRQVHELTRARINVTWARRQDGAFSGSPVDGGRLGQQM